MIEHMVRYNAYKINILEERTDRKGRKRCIRQVMRAAGAESNQALKK